MRVRVKEATDIAVTIADAFSVIEGKDKRVTTIRGPRRLLDKIRSWHADVYCDKTQTLWAATLTADESLKALFVTDEATA